MSAESEKVEFSLYFFSDAESLKEVATDDDDSESWAFSELQLSTGPFTSDDEDSLETAAHLLGDDTLPLPLDINGQPAAARCSTRWVRSSSLSSSQPLLFLTRPSDVVNCLTASDGAIENNPSDSSPWI